MKRIFIGLLAAWLSCAVFQPVLARGDESVKVVHAFDGADGDSPNASVIDVNGTLYGTTSLGGTQFYGAVFALDPITGAEKVLYSFCREEGRRCPTGEFPIGSLLDVNGTLYGTTEAGGANDGGTVFALDPKTGKVTVVHAFGCGSDGCIPLAGLIDVNGILYGTAQGGGNGGAVFAIDPGTGSFTTIYDFCSQHNCRDGLYPYGALIDVKGTLYGTTMYGGTVQNGTVFAIDEKSGSESVIYSFCRLRNCQDGALPQSSLIDVNGKLYGTTTAGGNKKANWGTVFSLDLTTGAENVLHAFCSSPHCKDGALPSTGLISVNDTLYGTTTLGGSDISCHIRIGCGVVFALDPATGAETVLHSFHNSTTDGGFPTDGLTLVNRTLYGTASSGGFGYGTVFSLKAP